MKGTDSEGHTGPCKPLPDSVEIYEPPVDKVVTEPASEQKDIQKDIPGLPPLGTSAVPVSQPHDDLQYQNDSMGADGGVYGAST